MSKSSPLLIGIGVLGVGPAALGALSSGYAGVGLVGLGIAGFLIWTGMQHDDGQPITASEAAAPALATEPPAAAPRAFDPERDYPVWVIGDDEQERWDEEVERFIARPANAAIATSRDLSLQLDMAVEEVFDLMIETDEAPPYDQVLARARALLVAKGHLPS